MVRSGGGKAARLRRLARMIELEATGRFAVETKENNSNEIRVMGTEDHELQLTVDFEPGEDAETETAPMEMEVETIERQLEATLHPSRSPLYVFYTPSSAPTLSNQLASVGRISRSMGDIGSHR